MICKNCGSTNNPDDAVFCNTCGKALNTEPLIVNNINFTSPEPLKAKSQTPEAPAPVVPSSADSRPTGPKKAKKKSLVFLIIIGIFFTLYGFLSEETDVLFFVGGITITILAALGLQSVKSYFTDLTHLKTLLEEKDAALSAAKENEKQARDESAKLRAAFTPEMLERESAVNKLKELYDKTQEAQKLRSDIDSQIRKKKRELKDLKERYIQLDDMVEIQEFGLYTPKYDFASSEQYKERLASIRERQKQLIRSDSACTGTPLTFNNSVAQGKKVVNDFKKLLLRAFNAECDELIDKVKFNTFETAEKRMNASRDAISKLGSMMSISITTQYFNAKYEELCLAFEYRRKKQEEKEEQREIKARLREEARLAKEIEEARRKVEKEQLHYQRALDLVEKQLLTATESEQQGLNDKKHQILAQLNEIDKAIKDIDYREANIKAGYVYIISNIGSFGENVYKIGMTRRLEPMDRVDELGDASVPFKFDVHAMIFSDDAPALEAALHRAFDDRKLNMVNKRREFFNVTLDEIEAVVKKNYDKTVEFVRVPDAEQYRESLKMKSAK